MTTPTNGQNPNSGQNSNNGQNPNRQGRKRGRNNSPDSQTSDYRAITSRRQRNRDEQTIRALAGCSDLTGSYTFGQRDGSRFSVTATAQIGMTNDAIARFREEDPNTVHMWSSFRPHQPIEIHRERTPRAFLRQALDNPNPFGYIEYYTESQDRDSRGRSSSRTTARPGRDYLELETCRVCQGAHHARDCIYLNEDNHAQPTHGLRFWCPFHNAPHSIDNCNQRWTWMSDPEVVRRCLITGAANGPPFATSLVHWPDLIRDTDQDLPWSAQYSLRLWNDNLFVWAREQNQGTITTNRRPDPATANHAQLGELPYQTIEGREPQFRGPQALDELVRYATKRAVERTQEIIANRALAKQQATTTRIAKIETKIEEA